MSKPLVSDALWATIAPLLPPEPPRPKGGRPRLPDRACLTGILFVLWTGCPWEALPPELGCGTGMTCWRRLRAWQRAGVWHRLHTVLLERLHVAGRIDWGRACLDSASIPAKGGAAPRRRSARTRRTGASPGRSGISWWTGGGLPWRAASPAPMSRTGRPSSSPSRRSSR